MEVLLECIYFILFFCMIYLFTMCQGGPVVDPLRYTTNTLTGASTLVDNHSLDYTLDKIIKITHNY